MSYFQPSNKKSPNYIQPDIQQTNQIQQHHGPLYQQPQVYQQYQGGYPPQAGIQPIQYGGNPHNYVVGQPPQNVVYPQYQGYPPTFNNEAIYPLQISTQQERNFSFKNLFHGGIIANNNICIYCFRPYTLILQRKIGISTFIVFLLLLIFFWPLCWLPFVLKECKDRYYYCSSCGKLIYKRQCSFNN
ncbi:unnamed protein product [Paramecium pentaurelia]|uniref:LITAF domain-containing protein n=1 Tax=Paramecium pentaurelia TaxID=43138 RepID=A0A8S1V4J1_9CILI|nr:unnamed protein product [Paramecium pentaurelia]